MAWSITQVARMSKVTSRTLRHYGEIGLLRPARVADNGLRYYEQEQLLRLQQILVLRELGVGLRAIGDIVDGTSDPVAALRAHHTRLLAERDRFDRLATTVSNTIAQLRGGDIVSTTNVEQWFDGLHDPKKQAAYEAEAANRWGARTAEANAETATWPKEKWSGVQQEWLAILERLVGFLDDGIAADAPQVVAAIDAHYAWICQFWTPNKAAYLGLGSLYTDDPGFRAKFDGRDPRLAEYLRDAMAAYASARLS